MRITHALHLNFKSSCGIAEYSVNVVYPVPTITAGPSLNLTKQRTVLCPVQPNEFHQKENKYAPTQIETNEIKSQVK
jgi:hypothetical protein